MFTEPKQSPPILPTSTPMIQKPCKGVFSFIIIQICFLNINFSSEDWHLILKLGYKDLSAVCENEFLLRFFDDS